MGWNRLLAGLLMVPTIALAASCRPREPARIGVVLGSEGVLAAKLALADLDARAGPGAQPLELRTLQGAFAGSSQIALAAAESLTADPRVVAVVGHANSSASLAASQIYNARQVVQLAPTTTAPLYAQAGPYSFRLVASDEHQARYLADEVVAGGARRIAVISVNDDYGRALRRLLLAELARRDVRPVYDGAYAEDERNAERETVAALAGARPDMLVWLGRSQFFALISAELRAALPALPILASDGFGNPGVDSDTLHRFDGVRYVRLVDVERGSPALRALRERYARAGGGELTDQAALAYDAVSLLGQIIREVGPDREAVRQRLEALGRTRPPFPGVTGPIAFSPDGDRAPAYGLAAIGARGPSRPER